MFRIVGKYRCLCARCAAPKSTRTIVDNGSALPLLKNDSTFATYIKFYFYTKKRKRRKRKCTWDFEIDFRKKKDTHMIDSLFSLFFTPTHVRSLTLPTLSIFCSLSEYNRRRSFLLSYLGKQLLESLSRSVCVFRVKRKKQENETNIGLEGARAS